MTGFSFSSTCDGGQVTVSALLTSIVSGIATTFLEVFAVIFSGIYRESIFWVIFSSWREKWIWTFSTFSVTVRLRGPPRRPPR